jgi:tetraacyldisaccharide 4'-kinase
VPVYISPDRAAAARALLAAHPQVNVLVSDDGLQHYALGRDLELAVVDGERLFGNGLPLPSGPLREPVARLESVDAVVMNGPVAAPGLGARRVARGFAMLLGRETFVSLANGETRAPGEFALALRGRHIAAIAGIGNPQRFFEHLARLGIRARGHAFDDHHAFQPTELKLPGVDVILMTEKDAVKCRAFADARMWFMRVEAILPPDFDDFLLSRLATARRSADGSQAA